jgi:hypothetical protein
MRVIGILFAVVVVAVLSGVSYTWLDQPSRKSPDSIVPHEPHSQLSDWNGDGLPDFLNLEGADTSAFRAWFTFLAETTYYQPPDQLPAEVNDCAALLRFAFREALKPHDGVWATALRLPVPPGLPPVTKYHYPETPIAPNLFRIKEGSFSPADLENGSFAQFADAETLRKFNTNFVSRDIRAALPGDLLFYRQKDQSMPDHAMVFLGSSHFENDARQWVVYHTGPIGSEPGEIRRPTLDDLLNHREPRWHPVAANASFLGVYRWNILQ